MTDTAVTVICLAYNHKDYIADALEGILRQQTTFPVEILVHDDASPDGTAEIIRDYDRRYPGRMTLICREENQFSKGIRPTPPMLDMAKGKYIAVCEGDDYWTDPLKLQKQYDAMESHPELDICAHAVRLEMNGKFRCLKPKERREKIFSVGDMVTRGGGFMATCSLFFRKTITENRPEFYEYLPIDYTLQIMGSLRGGLLFLKDEMGVYRYQRPDGWTGTVAKNRDHYLDFTWKLCRVLEIFDRETDGAHYSAVRLALYRYCKRITDLVPNDADADFTFRRIRSELSCSQKVYLFTKSARRFCAFRVKRILRFCKLMNR